MKLICNNTFINILCTMIKYIVALLTNSLCLFSNAIFDASGILKESALYNRNGDDKKKNKQSICNVLIGTIIIVVSLLVMLNIFSLKSFKVKWFVVLVSIITFILNNVSNSFKYVVGFSQEKKEIMNLNRDFKYSLYLPIFVIICYIATLFSKYISILKYADVFGAFVISLLTIILGIKFIYNNLHGINKVTDEIKELFKNTESIKDVKVEITNYGYSKKVYIDLLIDKNVQTISMYSKLLELCYEAFKKYSDVEVISIIKTTYVERKMVNVSARNSRSRNSKKNSTKKNSKQKNKKR